MMELSDYRRGLFQWDTGRSLIVTEKDITEVHFQLLPPPSGSTETTDVPVSAGIAKIPDELLQSGLPIRAYAWGDGYSHYDQTFCVTKREKPTGYASDPTDAITLESVQEKLQAEIDGKIQIPQGGDAGDVLKKTESGVEWGQAAGQSDWAENDETAPGYVKNRPFYTGEPVETVLVEESTTAFSDEGVAYGGEVTSTFSSTVGNTYMVYWDGAVYESVCADYRAGLTAIGNLSIAGAGADTGEPFLIVPNGSSIYIYTPDTSDTHTFSISGLVTEVVKIPDKYISDTFRDVVIAGNPLKWSTDDWTEYYGLFQNGKLLKINVNRDSNYEGYVLSMFYNAGTGITKITTITENGSLYRLYANSTTNEYYWSPVIEYGSLYLRYIQTGSNINPVNREEYDMLEVSDNSITFNTKNANEDAFKRKVVLEGDKEIVLSSSTTNSTKKFKITVDDTGTISATEV